MLQVPAGGFEGWAAISGFGVGVLGGRAVEVAGCFVFGKVVFLVADHVE